MVVSYYVIVFIFILTAMSNSELLMNQMECLMCHAHRPGTGDEYVSDELEKDNRKTCVITAMFEGEKENMNVNLFRSILSTAHDCSVKVVLSRGNTNVFSSALYDYSTSGSETYALMHVRFNVSKVYLDQIYKKDIDFSGININ